MREIFALFIFVGILLVLGVTVFGIYTCFTVSIVLGVVSFFIHPFPFIVGAILILGGPNVAQMVVDWFQGVAA
jgi:hypothetical protein